MDDSRDSSIPSRTGGPESDNSGSPAILDGVLDGVKGAIDPTLARDSGIEIQSPTDDFAASFAEAPKERRKTGRPRGVKNKQSDAGSEVPLNINGVEKILYSIHAVLSGITKIPELELDEKEAKELARAIAGVSDQYMLTIDPKKAAWIDLARVVGVVYGPRGISYYMRKKAEASVKHPPVRQQDAPSEGVVFQFDPKNQKPLGG